MTAPDLSFDATAGVEQRSSRGFLAYGALLVAGCVAAILLMRVIPNGAVRMTAMVYIVTEVAIATVGLVLLERATSREVTILNVTLARASCLREAQAAVSETGDFVHNGFATLSNLLIVAGMATSAAILVASAGGNPTAAAETLIAIAPKAFGATGLAIACGMIVSLRGHIVASAVRKVLSTWHRADAADPEVIPDGPTVTHALAAAVKSSNRSVDVAQRLHDSVRELPLAHLAEGLRYLGDEILASRRAQDSANLAIERLTEALTRENNQGRAIAEAMVALNQTLTTDRFRQLEAQREIFARETAVAATATLQRMADIGIARIDTSLETIAGRIQQEASEAYRRAYGEAAEHLRRVLGDAAAAAREVAVNGESATDALHSVGVAIGNLAQATHDNAGTLHTATSQFVTEGERLASAVQVYATALEALMRSRDDGLTDAEALLRSVSHAAEGLAQHARNISRQERKWAEAKRRLSALAVSFEGRTHDDA